MLDTVGGDSIIISMRALAIVKDGYYHVYNRGVSKQIIFLDTADFARFLFLLLHLQSPVSIPQVNRYIKNYLKTSDFLVTSDLLHEITATRTVEVVNFCIMPNHFHLLVHALEDGAISSYMQKVGNAYSKYFNQRYERSGHVFQGAYKVREIGDDNYLSHLSAYIHRNPHELSQWKDKADIYSWSSYQDMNRSRWGNLLKPEIIKDSFASFSDYRSYVETSGAKENFEDALII